MTHGIVRAKPRPCVRPCVRPFVRPYTYAAYVRIQRPLAPIVVVYVTVDKKIAKKRSRPRTLFCGKIGRGPSPPGDGTGVRDAGASRGAARGGGRRRETRRGFFREGNPSLSVVSRRFGTGAERVRIASRIAYRISHRGPSVRRSRCRRRDDARRRRRETAAAVAASVRKIKSLRRRFRSPASVAWRRARGRGRAPRAGNNPRTRTRTRVIARTATAGRAKRWGTERSGAPEGDENPAVEGHPPRTRVDGRRTDG